MEIVTIYYIFSIIVSISILSMLIIQSWVLVKLLPEIKRTAANSSFFTETLSKGAHKLGLDSILSNTNSYPKELTNMGITNCTQYHEKKHIHTAICFQ